MTKVDLIWIT